MLTLRSRPFVCASNAAGKSWTNDEIVSKDESGNFAESWGMDLMGSRFARRGIAKT